MAEHDLTDRDVTDKVWRLLEKAGVAFLTTAHGDALQARPMALYPRREEGAIYLLTSAETFKDDAIIRHPQISLAAQEGGRYVAVSGLAGVSEDQAKIAALWDMAAEAWWKGPEDPDIRLLTVRPQTAHYWKAPNKTAAAISMVVAAASGVKPSLGEDYKVRMS